jgi:radical SAM superfamily enzyme YgiQ (UPF0313 family)
VVERLPASSAEPGRWREGTGHPHGRRPLRLLLVNPTIVPKREHLHLGVATVASFVRRHTAHEVRILDFMSHRRIWRRRLREVVAEYRPDVVGMYVSSPYFPAAREVAAEIKRLTRAPLVAGGHHASLSPEEVLAVPHFDMLVSGEGEQALARLLDALSEGEPLDGVPGLWFREGGEIRSVPRAPLLEAAGFPPLDWSLHDEETLDANFYFWGILPVMASRGCPARCSFCSVTNIQRLYPGERFLRFRDPRQVVTEIEADYERYRDRGLRVVFFYDLNFLVNVRWLREFTDEYRRRGLHRTLKWSAYTRPDHVTPEAAECLRDSGCVNLRIGIEAANPYMRNVMYDKRVSQADLEAALARIKQLGISVTGYFMAGGPGERPEWLLESLELARRHGIEYPVFLLYQPLAGSDILAHAAEVGSVLREDRENTAADFLHHVSMRHQHIAGWQLVAFLLLTHALFGPRLVARQLRRSGWRYFAELAGYGVRALRRGFTPYGAFTYFTFYGADHLVEPLRLPAAPRPSLGWRAMMALTRLWLPHSGAPEPPAPAVARPALRRRRA